MSADVLREAAALMRERAEAAHAGPWEDRSHRDYGWVALYVDEDTIAEESLPSMEPGGSSTVHDAAHIASWHPAVALAVADWLDALSHFPTIELDTDDAQKIAAVIVMGKRVARAYLGRDA